MNKNPTKKRNPIKKHDPIVPLVANIHGVTASCVRKVRDGIRENEQIFDDYMIMDEGVNLLIAAVKAAVPFEIKVVKKPTQSTNETC